MPEHALPSRDFNWYWRIPIAVFIIFCVCEWLLWIFTPNAFFYPRGRVAPNLHYESTIHGDLSTGNIFVTPQVRHFTYISDGYSARNDTTVRRADAILLGQSFSGGGGSSQEFMPAHQLSELTGQKVVNSAERQVIFPGYDQFQTAAFILKFNKPIETRVLIFDVMDNFLVDALSGKTIAEKITDVIDHAQDYPALTPAQRFAGFKKYVKDYSPQAIVARKLKTLVKSGFLEVLYKAKIFKRASRTLDYIDHEGKVYAVPKMTEALANYPQSTETLEQMVEALDLLNQFAKKKGIQFLVTITPSKMIAYNRYVETPYKIKGYGPGQIFYDRLTQRGVQVVMYHKEMMEAVDAEMTRGGPFVYWHDDAHWSPYGISIGMKKVAEKLRPLMKDSAK